MARSWQSAVVCEDGERRAAGDFGGARLQIQDLRPSMAINIIEYNLMRRMRQDMLLPLGGDVLELGGANWYGDVDINVLLQDIGNFAPVVRQQKLRTELNEAVAAKRPGVLWEIAKVYWETFLQP